MTENAFFAFLALLVVASAAPAANLRGEALVDYINAQGKWKAVLNPRIAALGDNVHPILGSLTKTQRRPRRGPTVKHSAAALGVEIPKEFDSRTAWPECTDVISFIHDQSECGSCWAVSAAAVMTDRTCIHSGGKDKTKVSPKEATACAPGFGCHGGWPEEALDYWIVEGVVSGSSHAEDAGCQPYPFASCLHYGIAYYGNTTFPECPPDYYDTPACVEKCQPGYTTSFVEDKSYGKKLGYFEDEESIQVEVLTNGPIVVDFRVYEDFLVYGEGIYEHLTGSYKGGHAVRLIGWGEENGKKFWTIANQWNAEWGEKGTFRIVRGVSEVGIEDDGVAALPDFTKNPKKH